jgi:hypothetical protein
MYWWHKAAELVRIGKIYKFGLITTNTLSQVRQRKVVEYHQSQNNPIQLFFTVPDHPWVDEGASVRIAMTAGELRKAEKLAQNIRMGTVNSTELRETPEDSAESITISWKSVGNIFSNLQSGSDVGSTVALKSNEKLSCPGVQLCGPGFILESDNFDQVENEVIFAYLHGRDFMQTSRQVKVIDLFNLKIEEVQQMYPKAYQWVLERVKPHRETSRDKKLRENWWLFERPRPELREAIKGLKRYIATVETSKHRVFAFLYSQVLPDKMLIAIALDDAYFLGVLSSRVHVTWSLAAGGTLEDRPRYNKTRCFDPFPFPTPIGIQKQTIRELGERLDSHRKRVQATHPEVTITGMYNLLEKLRQGEPLDDKDKAFNQKALVSTLKQIHDELDAAVFAAYGWEPTLTDDQILENLVTLNAQRAEEERNGLIRWLRPDYQAPGETYVQPSLAGITTQTETPIAPTEQQPFPKTLKEQLWAIRDLFRTQSGEWTAAQVTAHFKAASRKQKVILDCLESLEDLGILLSHNEGGTTFWHLAELQGDR